MDNSSQRAFRFSGTVFVGTSVDIATLAVVYAEAASGNGMTIASTSNIQVTPLRTTSNLIGAVT